MQCYSCIFIRVCFIFCFDKHSRRVTYFNKMQGFYTRKCICGHYEEAHKIQLGRKKNMPSHLMITYSLYINGMITLPVNVCPLICTCRDLDWNLSAINNANAIRAPSNGITSFLIFDYLRVCLGTNNHYS